VKLGILGGTFDPIHVGHIAAAHAAIRCERLDKVLIVPSGTPPHRGRTIADASDRLEMCRLAAAGDPRLEVSDVEVRRGGRSYTVDTLRELKREHAGDSLFLILGWDAAQQFHTWRDPAEVLRLASVIVVTRPGSGALTEEALAQAGLGAGDGVCEADTPDISGSELRADIARGADVRDCVAAAVAAYIDDRGLYRDNRDIG
jgi:nicotinate-nucleotide adenylyltransferase